MQVNSDPLSEPLDGVVLGRRQAGRFSLHDRQTLVDNLLQLVLVEQVDDGAPGEDGVDVLQEALLLDVLVCEQESCPSTRGAGGPEEILQILREVCLIVSSGESYLECSVAGNE